MPAITISREIGSQGDWIASEVAQRLGYHLVDKHVLERIFQQYGFIKFNELYDSASFWTMFDPQVDEMVSMLNRVVQALAAHGKIVLVGRGGFAMLKNYADVLNVRIQAPYTLRIEQIMQEDKLEDKLRAEAVVKESDHIRQNFLTTAYGAKWNATTSFDMVLDTGKIPPEVATGWLVEAVSHLEKTKKSLPYASRLEIDPVLQHTINEILDLEVQPG